MPTSDGRWEPGFKGGNPLVSIGQASGSLGLQDHLFLEIRHFSISPCQRDHEDRSFVLSASYPAGTAVGRQKQQRYTRGNCSPSLRGTMQCQAQIAGARPSAGALPRPTRALPGDGNAPWS
jgi:hypothetical protein